MARLGKAGVDGVDLDSVGSERSTRTGKEGWNPPGNPPGTHWPRASGSGPGPSGRILKEDPIQPCRPGLAFRDLLVKIVGPCRNEPSHTTAAPPGPDNPHRLSAVLLAVCDGVGRWIGWQALQGNQRDVPSSPSLVPRLTPRIKVLLSTLHASPPSTCDSPATRLPTGTRLESTASPVYPSSVLPYPSRTRVSNPPFPSLGPASGAHHPLVLPPHTTRYDTADRGTSAAHTHKGEPAAHKQDIQTPDRASPSTLGCVCSNLFVSLHRLGDSAQRTDTSHASDIPPTLIRRPASPLPNPVRPRRKPPGLEHSVCDSLASGYNTRHGQSCLSCRPVSVTIQKYKHIYYSAAGNHVDSIRYTPRFPSDQDVDCE